MRRKPIDVALSFAGEQRDIAESIRTELESLGITVFYDDDQKSNLWGKDLFAHLTDVYHAKAEFCVILVSAAYKKKRWTVVERRAAQARAFSQDDEYILPIRIDSTELEGLLTTMGYVSWNGESATSIAKMVQQKLERKKLKGRLRFNSTSNTGVIVAASSPSVDSFQEKLSLIYKNTNKRLSLEYMYGYLSRTSAYLSKKVIQGTSTKEDFIRPLSWLCSLSSKLGIRLQMSFVARFPERCPSCGQRVCVCMHTGKKPPENQPAYRIKEELEAKQQDISQSNTVISFDWSARTVAAIYPANEILWRRVGPMLHFLKLQEEIGEIHESMVSIITKTKDIRAVSDEIADVLGWLISAWSIAYPQNSIDHELINYYYNGCPACCKETCICQPYLSRATNLFDLDTVRELAKTLENIAKSSPDYRVELTELYRSVSAVLETQDDPLARLTLFQVTSVMDQLIRKLRSARKDREQIVQMIAALEIAKRASSS
jgi:hypothetical protein